MNCNKDTSASTGQLSSASSLGGGMHHSLSTPIGVDGGVRTPPSTPRKYGKMLGIKVQMLDDTITIFQVQSKALGKVLFEQVCKQLHLLEADYFGLEYEDMHGTKYWLDLQKPVSRQLGLSLVDPLLHFCVKFYTPDPSQLEEEYTRYLFCLQVKRDLAQGHLQCNDNTAALMASYIVQAECGDFVAEDYPDHTYLTSYKFVPHQEQEIERKIMENHKKHIGQSPGEADLNLLETARRCELYGIKMHPTKDQENVPLNLAVAHMGIIVFQHYTKINTFSWAKIRKISFKRKKFLIKLHPEGYGYYKDTVEFFFESRNECKNFWKKCVENHGFFRCSSVKTVPRHKTRVLSRGSSFRYSGKTQKEIVEFVRDNYVKRQAFQRSASFRHTSSHSSSVNMHASSVGNSISAHPLLPLSDNVVTAEVSKRSVSLASMEEPKKTPDSPTMKSASLPQGTVMSWNSITDVQHINQLAQTMSSPSPPLTMQSISPATSATASPQHLSFQDPHQTTQKYIINTPPSSPPPSLPVTVHKTETGIVQPILTTFDRAISNSKLESKSETTTQTSLFPLQVATQQSMQNNTFECPQYTYKTSSDSSKRSVWCRSSSCRELNEYSFEESGKTKHKSQVDGFDKKYLENVTLESPVTRYDDQAIYTRPRNDSLEIHQDIMVPDQKVYSSSYPGTSVYSQESAEDPGNYDLRDSQDDITHDSYELLERSDDEINYNQKFQNKNFYTVRSCSLDSSNYPPSDFEYDSDYKQLKCKSSSDITYETLTCDDPRYYPRERMPRKSDGIFYKNIKTFSRTSSLESKNSDYCVKTSKKQKTKQQCFISRTSSSKDSKTENIELDYFDESISCDPDYFSKNLVHEYDRKIPFERNYGTQMKRHSYDIQTVPAGNTNNDALRNSKEYFEIKTSSSENNIFSFEEERIQILAQDPQSVCKHVSNNSRKSVGNKRGSFDDLFVDVEPKKVGKTYDNFPVHQIIERTKSDPNSLARQKLSSGSKRHLLMHQKSIDITPAESSDDDYLFRQIPSAPPITSFKGSYFDMPHAEFGHFDILTRETKGLKTKFEVPKSQFEVLGVKTQSDLVNPPKTEGDIPYILHKRLIMNGTIPKDEMNVSQNDSVNDKIFPETMPFNDKSVIQKSPTKITASESGESTFLFIQNIDLSKVDPVTLEIDKSKISVNYLSSPKRDITRIDPALLETLSSKLSQIESDSPTSSKTESLKPEFKISNFVQKVSVVSKDSGVKSEHTNHKSNKSFQTTPLTNSLYKDKVKLDVKQKRISKPRSQVKKFAKNNKTKVRITSFSSDDESLDSDDVFGSTEATPTKLEFSPPQTRKEMESILKFEAERKYLQYTMSSTEVEGSPPTTRKIDVLCNDRSLDPNFQTELRRISERSFSIPSSEDDLNINTSDLQSVFQEIVTTESTLTTVVEVDKEITDKNFDSMTKDLQTDEITELSESRTEPIYYDDFSKTQSTEELQREKALLKSQIEQDLQDLKVPLKTKITELCSPSASRKGQSPLLFTHARLNLSEGSAFTLLQKQEASESALPSRRAKSLDTPIIAIHRLPLSTAFSSKDDTVDEEHLKTHETSEQEYTSDEIPQEEIAVEETVDQFMLQDPVKLPNRNYIPISISESDLKVKCKMESDQIVPDLVVRRIHQYDVKTDPLPNDSAKEKQSKLAVKTYTERSVKITKPAKNIQQKFNSNLFTDKVSLKQNSLTTSEKEIKRTKSQETDITKKVVPKEKAKSLEKLEFKRNSSKERAKSQEDSDTDVVKRKEKQQMLYETAIKQTKTLKSPVKEILPVFPQVEESVRERGGKLEISINTIENPSISLEEAIIITKSPKRLDKKMDKKLTQSLELNISDKMSDNSYENMKIQRLGRSLDLENMLKDNENQELEFDFNTDMVTRFKAEDEKITVKSEQDFISQDLILEGTSLDVWLSVGDKNEQQEKLGDITIIQKSYDFFEERPKPPDLSKTSTKSSSDSTSVEKLSLGNSLDVRYIDESGDSSHKSESDAKLVNELQKSKEVVTKYIMRKMERRRKRSQEDTEKDSLIRANKETEYFKPITLSINQKPSYTKTEIENKTIKEFSNGKSEAIVDSIEKVNNEFKIEIESDINLAIGDFSDTQEEQQNFTDKSAFLSAEDKNIKKVELLKRNSDQSKSSDTGSWTSGEKDNSAGNLKETADESSTSCAIGQTIGLSQTIEKFTLRDQLSKSSSDLEVPRSPRSPKICMLGRAFTIDEESYGLQNKSDESISEIIEIPKDGSKQENEDVMNLKLKKSKYAFEEKWSDESELGQKVQQKIVKKLKSSDRNSTSSTEEKCKNNFATNSKLLSADSKSSMDTESSSGSLGFAAKLIKGDIAETNSSWKPFPLESSGSSSIEDGGTSNGLEKDHEYFVSASKVDDDVTSTTNSGFNKDELIDFPTNFGYPSLTSTIGGIGLNISGTDILAGYSSTLLGRTLSRISERSSNSEKSSIEEDSTKASTHLDSINDGSLTSSEHNASLSSDTPSNARKSDSDKDQSKENEPEKRKDNLQSTKHSSEPVPHFNNLLLQRQVSDDRRTSAEMAELSIDDIEIITSESGLRLKRQGSDDTVIDEECFEYENKHHDKKGSSSQESEDWPLPEIPQHETNERNGSTPLFSLHDAGSSDASQLTTQVFKLPQNDIPKVFGLRGSLKSQDSEPWPSPPSSIQEVIVVENIQTHYVTPEEASRVVVGPNFSSGACDDILISDEQKNDKGVQEHIYENIPPFANNFGNVRIILEEKCSDSPGSNSEDFNLSNLNDDVFVDSLEMTKIELKPPAVLRRSTASDDSSHSGHKSELKPPPYSSSHSSYSEEDHTSSLGTNLEDGTVRFALNPTKCTHSSHSEDTSIALSLSEWSNSTNTVKLPNLSTSNSAATKSSSGLKSDDNSLADIAPSLSEWSSSNSNTLKAHQNSGINFQRLSSSTSTGDSNTLTDFIQTVSEKSSTDSKTLTPQQFFLTSLPPRQNISRLGSSVDDLEVPYEQKNLKSPQNIPSEDFAILSSSLPNKVFPEESKKMKKSIDRPVTIPSQVTSSKSKLLRSSSTNDQKDKRKTSKTSTTNRSRNWELTENPVKTPLAKCSPYYSSSLSSESNQMTVSKTATVPLIRTNRKSLPKTGLHVKTPVSENDSTSSVESPKSSVERRALRRKKQKHKTDKERMIKTDYMLDKSSIIKLDPSVNQEEINYNVSASLFESMYMSETLEEGYFPDGDSQSGSDVFRMEKEDENQSEQVEEFDLKSIPPPVLEDDFENDSPSTL